MKAEKLFDIAIDRINSLDAGSTDSELLSLLDRLKRSNPAVFEVRNNFDYLNDPMRRFWDLPQRDADAWPHTGGWRMDTLKIALTEIREKGHCPFIDRFRPLPSDRAKSGLNFTPI